MADIYIYEKKTGEIISQHTGHPHDKDPLTEARQKEMLVMMFPERYYDVGMVVSEGDNSVFPPDILHQKNIEEDVEIDGVKKKVAMKKLLIKTNKVKDITGKKPE